MFGAPPPHKDTKSLSTMAMMRAVAAAAFVCTTCAAAAAAPARRSAHATAPPLPATARVEGFTGPAIRPAGRASSASMLEGDTKDGDTKWLFGLFGQQGQYANGRRQALGGSFENLISPKRGSDRYNPAKYDTRKRGAKLAKGTKPKSGKIDPKNAKTW